MGDSPTRTEQIVAEFESAGLRFDQAMAQTSMAVCITDPRLPDNPIVFANAAFLKLTGYRLSDVLGRNCRMLQGQGTNREHTRLVHQAIEARKAILVELLNYRKDGTPFWNALHVAPILDDKGELLYYFGSQLDISDVHAARQSESRSRLASDNVSHRLKSVARRMSSILSGRKARAKMPGSDEIAALGKAYDPASPPMPTADLGEIIQRVMGVYDVRGAGRVSAEGPAVSVPEDRVGMVGLCLHELATYALEHGAWSQDGGHISIRWSCPDEGRVEIDWKESGIQNEPIEGARGLGLPLLQTLMEGVQGQLSYTPSDTGAHMRLSLPLHSLEAQFA